MKINLFGNLGSSNHSEKKKKEKKSRISKLVENEVLSQSNPEIVIKHDFKLTEVKKSHSDGYKPSIFNLFNIGTKTVPTKPLKKKESGWGDGITTAESIYLPKTSHQNEELGSETKKFFPDFKKCDGVKSSDGSLICTEEDEKILPPITGKSLYSSDEDIKMHRSIASDKIRQLKFSTPQPEKDTVHRTSFEPEFEDEDITKMIEEPISFSEALEDSLLRLVESK